MTSEHEEAKLLLLTRTPLGVEETPQGAGFCSDGWCVGARAKALEGAEHRA